MGTAMPNAGGSAYYTIREAAWLLGARPSDVSRAIRTRTLRAVLRRGRLVVPAGSIVRLLGEQVDQCPDSEGTP